MIDSILKCTASKIFTREIFLIYVTLTVLIVVSSASPSPPLLESNLIVRWENKVRHFIVFRRTASLFLGGQPFWNSAKSGGVGKHKIICSKLGMWLISKHFQKTDRRLYFIWFLTKPRRQHHRPHDIWCRPPRSAPSQWQWYYSWHVNRNSPHVEVMWMSSTLEHPNFSTKYLLDRDGRHKIEVNSQMES